MGDVANNLAFQMTSMFLMVYMTDIVGLSAGAAGTIYASPRSGRAWPTSWPATRSTRPTRAGDASAPGCCGAPRRWRSCPALGHCAAPAASGPNRSAEGILAQRYADGDITTDEYYERLSLLQAR